MENKEIEIPFGAKDSELIEATYHIPYGMEAIIESDKVIIRKKESADERIREELISLVLKVMGREKDNLNDEKYDKMLDWLDKQGEKTVIGNGSNSASVSDGDNSVTSKEVVSQPTMLSKDEQYTLARIIESLEDDGCPTEWLTLLNDIYSMTCQKSTEWSKEDIDFKTESVRYLCNLRDTFEENKWDTKPIQRCINWLLEFPKPQFYWKPSKEQMKALYDSIPEKVMEISERAMLLNELYKDLMKLPNAPKQEVNEEEIIAKHITNDSLSDVVNDRLNKCGWYVTEKHSNLESIGEKWSEEDEYTLYETIQHLEELIRIDKAKHLGCDVQYYQRDIDWLKSLKERIKNVKNR